MTGEPLRSATYSGRTYLAIRQHPPLGSLSRPVPGGLGGVLGRGLVFMSEVPLYELVKHLQGLKYLCLQPGRGRGGRSLLFHERYYPTLSMPDSAAESL